MIIPSIDIEGGRAVKRIRGQRGNYIFQGDPLELAARFRKAPLVHVVDLDGAEAGGLVNISVISKIAEILEGRCELGGGLRSLEAVERALSLCQYAVVGSLPFKNWPLFRRAAELYRDRLAVSLDYRGGEVLVGGWREKAASIAEAVRRLEEAGPYAAVIVTSVEVEGTGGGVKADIDVKSLKRIARRVFYAGGVRDCNDVEKAYALGFDGVIVGYALYAGDLKKCANWY
ncbi:HisA/HisF-related TIM barrel protein [Pyrobaculum aerophilum]|uniref:1-(5-phosphoribosyl)-5-[(5-phosphoribosylamino)methylideneamino] imidazole-4-carboxamide isomerase n=1 Tax=Pyrobaculum aerophilum TaxID=13773 RepID=A0A371R3X1_9CREN|nr:HisA/HisF-related TIM barrel protein [Pyrobaculum aerophilum]RFA98496.1 1-(5-phosphoribosyl)-5-((5-phosphoribosylamino)methylideneamino)imidazole-4-carboxamide isomerase [Pyrobaculum aerophilum]RFA99985.1 1-(5-phosphoribosyl)-5-((5-phosphoribosylamino)methylideneamino)imidazole-4-carboxamide isomerase [Pyrobaculum aerophilum]